MRSYLVCFLAFVALPCLAVSDDPLADLKNGQPKDVAALIDRIVECNHWSGEEPYDAERRKEIQDALADLKCDRLAADEARALKRHANNPTAIRAIKEAKELSY
jgi:hypothetical protein